MTQAGARSSGLFRRLWNGTRYSLQGLRAAFGYEEAFRQEVAGRAMDLGSAAVFITILLAVATWALCLFG